MGQMPTSNSRSPKGSNIYPRTVRVGGVSVKVYRGTRQNGSVYYVVADYSHGKRKRRTIKSEDRALSEAKRIARKISQGEVVAAQIDHKQAASLARSLDLLAPTGDCLELSAARYAEAVQLLDGRGHLLIACVEEYTRRHPSNIKPLTVDEAVERFLKSKSTQDLSTRYLSDLKQRLQRFGASFRCSITHITPNCIKNWLESMKLAPQSIRNYRTVLNTFFEYHRKNGCVIENPIDLVESVKVHQPEKAIYTSNEMRLLIDAADEKFMPYLLIAAFAGLRSAEIQRLCWADVKKESIIVSAEKAKTRSRRIVPMLPNLRKALIPYRLESQKIWESSTALLSRTQQETARRAGIIWKANALRHSYASYRLALIKDENQVAYELGNSGNIIHRHYKELVEESESKEWFSILQKL